MPAADKVRVDLDVDEIFRRANETDIVRAKIYARAVQIANRARRIDAQENGGNSTVELQERVMANGRYVVHVRMTDDGSEHGTSKRARRRTLRRAVGKR